MNQLKFPLHPKQWKAFNSIATEILYGGSAGGGKSHLMRVAAIVYCLQIAGLQVYLFRRTYDDLIKNHMEGPTGFYSLLAPWLKTYVDVVDCEIRFNNGSKIYLCHCQHEKDRFKYQGAEMHVLMIDELTHFTEVIYRFLRSRVRIPESLNIPQELKGKFPRILCDTNPGGIGHQFVKKTWIDSAEPYKIYKTPPSEGGFLRQFIPARLSDNPSLDREQYAANLSGLGNPAIVKAMLEGDWDIVAGAALDISRERHLIRPFKPLQHWVKFQVLDWGYVRPYACGWYCVPDEDIILAEKDGYSEKYIPKGALILYRELYGTNGNPNEGSREESDIVARKIITIERDNNESMDYRVADTAIWAKNDGMSIFERMHKATDGAFNPRQSIKDRQANYSEVCSRLRGIEIEKGRFIPMFYATSNCQNFWRTVPSLILDDLHPEKGPDTNQEDHCLTADTLIRTDEGDKRIDQIITGNMVLTSEGYKPCVQLGITSRQKVYKITFSDNSYVRCTNLHRFLCSGSFYLECERLRKGDVLCRLLSYPKRNKSLTERLIGFAESISADSPKTENVKDSTVRYGNITKGIFLRAITCITWTVIDIITKLKTLLLSNERNIYLNTFKTGSKTRIGLSILDRFPSSDANAQKNGTDQKKARHGILNKLKSVLQSPLRLLISVSYAVRILFLAVKESFAPENANNSIGEIRILSIQEDTKENVWNLHVAGPNNFVLSNGVIVHNCFDHLSYSCMSRPFSRTKDQRIATEFLNKRRKYKLDNIDPYKLKPTKDKKYGHHAAH